MQAGKVSQDFWNAQNAFWTRSKAAQKKASKLKFTPMASRFYMPAGSPPPMQWRINESGKGYVKVQTTFYAELTELINTVAPTVMYAFDQKVGNLAFEAWVDWPTFTGLSKSMLELKYWTTDEGNTLWAAISSLAPYTAYIPGQPYRKLLGSRGQETIISIKHVIDQEYGRGYLHP